MALVPIIHDVEESVREIESLAGKPGIKGIMIPTMWHDNPSYGHPMLRPGVGGVRRGRAGGAHPLGRGRLGLPTTTTSPSSCSRCRSGPTGSLWQLLLSGKFDKFPNLKYAAVECGSYWLGDLLWKADTNFGANPKVKKLNARTKGLIQRLPSEYVGTNVFIGASTMSREEIRRRHVNGIDALMWGTDYPHPEGSWPHTARAAGDRLPARSRSRTPDCCSASTPCECYDLDLAALTEIAAQVGPDARASCTRTPTCAPRPTPIREARWWFDDYGMEWKG